ncbi:MAG: hypothetical protein GWN07_26080, partial [Actinobacteria bacterium]|nr:hypothetical protein [Actinomycetota bacterium]NIX23113.1 hypothetical protein [Actinomycetota bacterium]
MGRWVELGPDGAADARLFAADLDNNGALDLVASVAGGTRVWLQDADGYRETSTTLALRSFEVTSGDDSGHPALLGLADGGTPTRATISGSRGYGWVRLRPRAAERAGDQRINSYGLGGFVELRSGLLYQRRPIAGPTVHFGLGERTGANVARIVWPNGVVQAEFDLEAEETIQSIQRLKGSCPWVFAFDGSRIRFVTDFLWRSPLGMRINARQSAAIATTEDWVLIRGNELQARAAGYYDLRITAELWETHFFDHVSLRAVDHPPGTEVFVDERFAVPPPEMTVHITGPLQPLR